jgi:osmotically-inducible protein OsmY
VHLEQDIGSKEICVFCLNGIVALSGTVLTDGNYGAAEAAARRAIGISAVVNNIRIETHVEAAPPPAVRIPALAAHAPTA